MKRRSMTALFCLMLAGAALTAAAQEAGVLEIGSRLEPFLDAYLIESLDGAALTLHEPVPAERVLYFDRPWEGRFCGYVTVIKTERLYHLYYRGVPAAGNDGNANEVTCYAVSVDGINWAKPDLGIYEIHGTRKNNVILADSAPFSHNFCPFYDNSPKASPDQQFKAVAGTGKSGLAGFVSPDGVHWSKLRDEPIITGGAFDSQNLVFWSDTEQCYVCYFRIFSDGFRSVSRCTSPDFVQWSPATEMSFGDTPREHLYTNQTRPYFRAPH
ncbi:MAG: hypothetical protein JXR94_02450, partial [Candidatus Hydrogenedentes bacterium]|nr:hypothetical protein [Candidatus Hydrogenedentota bacterium]